jgi:hypothetical protein
MNRLLLGIILAPLLLIGSIALLSQVGLKHTTYRYRLTVQIEADGQVKTGSSVIEVRKTDRKDVIIGYSRNPHLSAEGEAVHIDLGRGRNVFALAMTEESAEYRRGRDAFRYGLQSLAAEVFFRSGIDTDQLEWHKKAKRATIGGKTRLEFLSFRDVRDIRTAFIVEPNDFGRELGSDVKYLGAWIDITNEPVTQTIEKVLPWLPNLLIQQRKQGGVLQRTGEFLVTYSLFKWSHR